MEATRTTRPQDHRRELRRGRPVTVRVRRGAEPARQAEPVTETWGDMLARHRRERHEAHLLTAEALNDLDQAIRRAKRWCDALEHRLEREGRRISAARHAVLR